MYLLVAQKFAASCGLACIASILEKSEESLLKENLDILSLEKLNFMGLFAGEIVELLSRYGHDYISEEFSKKKHTECIHKMGTILFINKNKQYPIWHYLLLTPHGWMNSWDFRIAWMPRACFESRINWERDWIIFRKE